MLQCNKNATRVKNATLRRVNAMQLTSTTNHPADVDVFEHWLSQAVCLHAAAQALSEYLDTRR